MATATITLKDAPDGSGVDVTIVFSDPGMQEESPAHVMAVGMVHGSFGTLEDDGAEECGHG